MYSSHFFQETELSLFHVQNIVADMRKVLAKNPQVEQQKLHRRVFLENIDPENQALKVELKIPFTCFFRRENIYTHAYLCKYIY